MSATPDAHSPVRPTVSPSEPAQALQLPQGAYYVVAGLLTAIGVELWEPETGTPADLTRAWVGRGAGLAFAAFGVALATSGRRRGQVVPAGAGMWAGLAAVVVESGAIVFGLLPTTFLIDVIVQAVFLVCWVAFMFRRVGQEATRTGSPVPAVG
ncbi:hypothetical protein J0H58_09870 [bacterium]|nr:hypothetical protein [bacterium]